MKMSPLSILTNVIVCVTCVAPISAQVVLCDIAGCVNGECLEPPIVSQPTCNCSTGYRSYTNANVCEDIDECSQDPYRCGYSYMDNMYGGYNYRYQGYSSYWPYTPSGRCVNILGSYYCLCIPPNRPVNRASSCIAPPRRRNVNPYAGILTLGLLNEL